MHPKLAVPFARWLDTRFSIWCDLQIDGLLRGTHQAFDWRKQRSAAAASFKVMAEVLLLTRRDQGKECKPGHFMCEAKLVAWALTGKFEKPNRDSLPADELTLLASLEDRNAVLLARGVLHTDRKKILEQHALDWRAERQARLGKAA